MKKHELIDSVAYEIRRLRLATGQNQSEAARAMDRNVAIYNRIESGKKELTLSELFELCAFFGVKPSAIVSRVEGSPEELDRLRKLEVQVDELTKVNCYLRSELRAWMEKGAGEA